MMVKEKEKIKVIIVDNSLAFRWMMRNLLESFETIEIISEADNGIDALKAIMHDKPDVLLMDLEMPVMDGMTALQHLMVHIPIPTIIFSTLTRIGTPRCFDTLKNGAVDFISKDGLQHGRISEKIKKNLYAKVHCAANTVVRAIEPNFPTHSNKQVTKLFQEKLIFCEECGNKKKVSLKKKTALPNITCDYCGEFLLHEHENRYIRANCVSILLAGEGSFNNLLKLVPLLKPSMNGALIVLIDGTVEHVGAFTEYLNAISTISVIRIQDGLTIEGGNCYIGCDNESIYLKPFSAHYTLHCRKDNFEDIRPMDMTMTSISTVFQERTVGIVLSGNSVDGVLGVQKILNNKGNVIVLDPQHCLQKNMAITIIEKHSDVIVIDEDELAKRIESLHIPYRDSIVTA